MTKPARQGLQVSVLINFHTFASEKTAVVSIHTVSETPSKL